jgi:bla regulator protein blaR1
VGVLLHAGLNNAVWTVGLALGAAIGSRLWRSRPAVGHALWLLVLLKLVTPSLVRLAMPVAGVAVRELPPPVVPLESSRPGSAREPSVDLGPVVAENTPRDEPPADVSHEASVAIALEPAQPPVPRTSILWMMARRMVVPAVGVVWLGGAMVWWSVIGIHSARFRRLLRAARPAPADLCERIGRVAERLGLSIVPETWILPAQVPPLIWVPLAGPSRLVLPEELWGRLSTEQQDAVMAHELAHLKRRDHWVRRLEVVACGLYWWDPVAWWARRQIEWAEERCCDAWVLWALPAAAGAYAEALVMTGAYLAGFRRPLPSGASGVGRHNHLKGRLHMILDNTMTIPVTRTAPRVLLILGAVSLPFLPVAAWGEAPVARAVAAAAEASAQDQAAKAEHVPAEKLEKANDAPPLGDQKEGPPPAPPLSKVRVAQPVVREVSDFRVLQGKIVASRQVELRPRVSGALLGVNCRPGQMVKQGERLFTIDPRPYKAELDKAQAELERARSQRKRCQIELAQAKKLAEHNGVGPAEVELFEGKLVEADATVRVAEAAVASCALKLEFTEVTAPFSGTISGPVLGPGNVAVADTTQLATIVSIDSVSVAFDVDERTILSLNRLKLRKASAAPQRPGENAEKGANAQVRAERTEIQDEELQARIEDELRIDPDIVSYSDRIATARANLDRHLAIRKSAARSKADALGKRMQDEIEKLRAKQEATRVVKYSEILKRLRGVATGVGERQNEGEAWAGPTVAVGLSDEEGFPHRGTIESMDVSINRPTGSASWRASIPNGDGLLLPGMFVRVRLMIRPAYQGLLVPSYAVFLHDGRTCVFVVTDQNIVLRRLVRTTGALHEGGLRLVEGIKADEWVVVAQLTSPGEEMVPWPAGIKEGQKVLAEKGPIPVESSAAPQNRGLQ